MNVRNVLSAILIVTAGLVANDTLAQSTQEIPDLFKPMTSGMIKALGLTAGVGADVVPEKDPTVVRSRLVELDSKILSQHLSDFDVNFAEAAPIRFNLFEDVAFVMITDRVEFVSEVQIHVVGHSIDDDRSRAYFVVHHGKITGNIYIDNVQYQIRPVDEDVQSITQIDQGGFVDELEPDAPDIERDEQDGSELDSPPNEPAVIDVAVFYTKRTRTQSNDIDAEISLAVLLTNESYANSQISQRLRLVYVAEVDYSGSGDLRLDRDRLQEPNDSHLDSVHPLRDARKADLVSLWVENGSEGACGIAFIMNVVSPTFAPFGFSVVRRKCATGYYSFGHELGHNMGARHDRRVDTTDMSPFNHNHAYVKPNKRWRTIMGYNRACKDISVVCERVQFWSNPDVALDGVPMGIASPSGNAADNRLTLNKTASVVAGFR